MDNWLLNHLFNLGDQADPAYSTDSTFNWLRALSLLAGAGRFETDSLTQAYANVSRRPENFDADTRAFECLLMAMHNVSALRTLQDTERPYDLVRCAVVSWYYAVYESASAMTLATSGGNSENHAGTARIWQADIVSSGHAICPFDMNVTSLLKKDFTAEIDSLRNGSDFKLIHTPQNEIDAWGAACGYLSGTSDFERLKAEKRLKASKDFKDLNVSDFRTKRAQQLRDAKLGTSSVNFLVQSFRFRGKANYRDSIYLSYGEDRTESVKQFLKDLSIVATAFLRMANFYVSRRVNDSR